MGLGVAGYTLVIDPGHGGMDGGAESADGVCEKDINLAIGKKLLWLSRLFGFPCAMTRESDISLDYHPDLTIRQNKTADLRARVEFARLIGNPVVVSVHLNKFEQSQYKGAQTFYAVKNPLGKPLALLLQQALVTQLDPQNNRVAKAVDAGIYLTRHLECPTVIVECGFLSNPGEAALLQQDAYQKKIAQAIFSGYVAFLTSDPSQLSG